MFVEVRSPHFDRGDMESEALEENAVGIFSPKYTVATSCKCHKCSKTTETKPHTCALHQKVKDINYP